MNAIGTVMREVRERLGESQTSLSYRLRTPATTINRWENNKQEPSASSIQNFVQATGQRLVVTEDGWSDLGPPTQDIPCYGEVPCGRPLLIDEAPPEQVDLADLTDHAWHDGQCYLVKADGDSMEPSIRDGDWLVVRRLDSRLPQVWDIVVAVVEGETVIAQVRPHPGRDDWHTLGKLNERYAVTLDDGDDVRLIGHVVGSLRWRPMRE